MCSTDSYRGLISMSQKFARLRENPTDHGIYSQGSVYVMCDLFFLKFLPHFQLCMPFLNFALEILNS